jgi:hypothetical protein
MTKSPFLVFLSMAVLSLTARAMVSITEQPENSYVPVGVETWISVQAEGTGTLNIQWYKNGQPIAGATKAILNLPPFPTTQTNLYQAKITDPDSVAWSEEAELAAIDLAERMGISGSTLSFESSATKQYTNLIPEDGTGISFQAMTHDADIYQKSLRGITLNTQGPAIITFEAKQRMKSGDWELSLWGQSQYFV